MTKYTGRIPFLPTSRPRCGQYVAARIIDSLGEWGVGVLILGETLFPPIPSEILLAFAGFLATQGAMNVVLVFITSTLALIHRSAWADDLNPGFRRFAG